MASLTPQEKVKIRGHLGYLGVQEAQTFVMGVPAGVETQFIVEGAMDRLLDESLTEVRRLLQILDSLEEQMVADHELLAVEKLGEITVNTKEQHRLTQRYDYWVSSLCNLLGVFRNPFDRRISGDGTTGINAQVK